MLIPVFPIENEVKAVNYSFSDLMIQWWPFRIFSILFLHFAMYCKRFWKWTLFVWEANQKIYVVAVVLRLERKLLLFVLYSDFIHFARVAMTETNNFTWFSHKILQMHIIQRERTIVMMMMMMIMRARELPGEYLTFVDHHIIKNMKGYRTVSFKFNKMSLHINTL